MTNEQKRDFTLRISQANKSALVVILYDIFLAYAKEAEEASPAESAFHIAIANARGALSELIDSLRMEYDIAQSTYQLYRFVERELIRADIKRSTEPVPPVINSVLFSKIVPMIESSFLPRHAVGMMLFQR